MRSFSESLDSEHESNATSVKVKVRAVLIDAISFEETLTWSKNTRKVQGQGHLAMLDRAKEQLVKLLQAYRTYCESRKVLPPPTGGERAASMLRCPARVTTWSLLKEDQNQIGNVQSSYLRILHSEQSLSRPR